MAKNDDDTLREMALHRGLRLIKSRRRKPGVGDFGKFGLTDVTGKPLLGIGKDALTASAEDIEAYLRTSELSTWKQSAEMTPVRRASRQSVPPISEIEEGATRRRRKTTRARSSASEPHESVATHRTNKPETAIRPALRIVPKAGSRMELETKSAPKAQSQAKPAPVLHIRAVAPSDTDALFRLLGQLGGVPATQADIAANLIMIRKAKAGMIVAELDGIVGCCGWAVLATVHRGQVGRLTALVVDSRHRRKGIGTEMLAAAEKELIKAGCRQIEAMSDIAINNSHNFFRNSKFEQTSYRFLRLIEK